MSVPTGDEFHKMLDDYRKSDDWKNYQRRIRIASFLTGWMRHIPYIGRLVEAFWYCLIEEGPYSTLKPRWGALTFAFLNDGRPTIWHTWVQIAHHDGPHSGIYQPKTAPHSLEEAREWDKLPYSEWRHNHSPRW